MGQFELTVLLMLDKPWEYTHRVQPLRPERPGLCSRPRSRPRASQDRPAGRAAARYGLEPAAAALLPAATADEHDKRRAA